MKFASIAATVALVLLIAVAPINAQITDAQVKMLQEFYTATTDNGNPKWKWNEYEGWNTSFTEWGDPCTFYGLDCKPVRGGTLTTITLSANNLKGSIPKEFFKAFPNVTELYFDRNPLLTGPVPEFSKDSQLKFFFSNSSSFTGTIPDSIFVPSLFHLDFAANKMGGTIPKAIENSWNLHYLYLGDNSGPFGGAVPKEVCTLYYLSVFDIISNRFTSIPPCFAKNQPGLTVMNFYNNELSGTIPEHWCDATNLNVFQIQLNRAMDGTIPSCIYKWSKLQTLGIEDTQISGTIPEEVFQLHDMITLVLSQSQFHGDIPDYFGNFTQLEHVTIEGNAEAILQNKPTYGGKFPKSLFQLDTLQALSIQFTRIKDTLPSLDNLTSLQQLDLANNKEITLNFPAELLNTTWQSVQGKGLPARELHLEETPLTGIIPNFYNATNGTFENPKSVGDIPAAITLFNTDLTGFIPNSTLDWMPKVAQTNALRDCFKLFAPIPEYFWHMTNNYKGMLFQILAARPTRFSMDGGEVLELVGSNFHGIEHPDPVAGTSFFRCGFCTAPNYQDCDANGNTSSIELTDAHFNKTTEMFECQTPEMRHTFGIYVDLYYVGYTYGTTIDTMKVSEAPALVFFYDPRPSTFNIFPKTGRREGCSRVVVQGVGFLNAPAPVIVFSPSDNMFEMAEVRVNSITRNEKLTKLLNTIMETDVVSIYTFVNNDTHATGYLPFANNKNFTDRYNESLGDALHVRFYPNGPNHVTGWSNASYEFAQTCTTPLVKCQYGYNDTEFCPIQPMCRCHSTGTCDWFAKDDKWKCDCGKGFAGAACDECQFNRYGKLCQPCPCVAGHGTCNWGIHADGTCNCNKWYLGATCNISKLGVAIGVPASVLVIAGVLLYFRIQKRRKMNENGALSRPMNAQ